MASIDDIQAVLRDATMIAMIKYSGGSPITRKGKKSKAVTEEQAIIADHFRKSNKQIYAALSAAYKKAKMSKVGDKPILVFSGALRDSIIKKAKIFDLGKGTFLMRFPKAMFYAGIHARGDGVPIRHPTYLTKSDIKRYNAGYIEGLKSGLASLGKGVTKRVPRKG